MRLRSILMVLSLLTLLSVSVGGFLYYDALRSAAIRDAERQAVSRLAMIQRNLSSYLSENVKPVQAMAGMADLLNKLTHPGDRTAQDKANAILDHFKRSLAVEVCYLMDYTGTTVASSNRDAPDSFVGKNFAFRPYFQQAFHTAPATYMALGVTSQRRGVYFSYPVFETGEDIPIGLAVIKASIERVEKELGLLPDENVLVTDPQGIIFISNRRDWLYHSMERLEDAELQQIKASRQFGKGPWQWLGIRIDAPNHAVDRQENEYLLHRTALPHYPGWQILHLKRLDSISKNVSGPLIRTAGPVIISLCFLIGISVFILYRQASQEILKRKTVERALRQSEERYRSLYHRTPAMLHSIDSEGRLLSVSDYWIEAMGYPRQEVIGKPLTHFLTEDSRRYAQQHVMPSFFKTGFCKDISYQFVKNDGRPIDILLSAVADKDEDGRIVRSLAVSIDVTERKRAEEALKQTKEKLSQYSKDLERQVRERTREISNILKYTPDVVYIKDRQGRYLLINSRYEEILQMSNEEVRGKRDHDILPAEIADQFLANDKRVLSENRSIQVEEHFPQSDGVHTYLSVKFPFYDANEQRSGVCGISTDITAVKKAQNQLRRLSGSIMANQEKERSAIARELHDELGQVLTALRMDAVWMATRLEQTDPKAAQRALTMCDLIDKNIDDVRSMAIRLRPVVLDDLGLLDALEWIAADFEKRTGISCVFEHKPIPAVADTIATAAYRIAQEALTNVARHAEAGSVDITLLNVNGLLTLRVHDDGCGFAPDELTDSEGLGVAGMRERAALVGGWVDVASQPDKGSMVTFSVPLPIVEGTVNDSGTTGG